MFLIRQSPYGSVAHICAHCAWHTVRHASELMHCEPSQWALFQKLLPQRYLAEPRCSLHPPAALSRRPARRRDPPPAQGSHTQRTQDAHRIMATASASGLLSFVQINKRLSKLPKAPLSYLLSHSIATRVYESTRRRRETHKRVGVTGASNAPRTQARLRLRSPGWPLRSTGSARITVEPPQSVPNGQRSTSGPLPPDPTAHLGAPYWI